MESEFLLERQDEHLLVYPLSFRVCALVFACLPVNTSEATHHLAELFRLSASGPGKRVDGTLVERNADVAVQTTAGSQLIFGLLEQLNEFLHLLLALWLGVLQGHGVISTTVFSSSLL